MKRSLVFVMLLSSWACTTPRSPVPPVEPAPSPALPPTTDPQHYARNTPEETRAVHRLVVTQLQASKWDAALDAVEGVLPDDYRRSLTEYLKLIAAVRLSDQALAADRYADYATRINVDPGLLSEQRKSLDQHRAWIAAIQDVLADEAVSRNFQRPRPENLPPALAFGWDSRGASYDATMYNLTKEQFKNAVSTLDGRLAMADIFQNITALDAHRVLYVDLTPFHFDSYPPMALPAEAGL